MPRPRPFLGSAHAASDAKDAARYRYLVRNRNWHLLKLLADGKGDEKAFHNCVDRCLESEAEIRAAG